MKIVQSSQRIAMVPGDRCPQAGAYQPRGRHRSEDDMHDRRLEGTAHAAGSTPHQGASPNGHRDLSPAGRAARLAGEWATSPRWRGVKRAYSAADVIRLRGSVQEEHTLARLGAERLWSLLHTEDF